MRLVTHCNMIAPGATWQELSYLVTVSESGKPYKFVSSNDDRREFRSKIVELKVKQLEFFEIENPPEADEKKRVYLSPDGDIYYAETHRAPEDPHKILLTLKPYSTKTALISVYNKDGIVEFGQKLIENGWDILASGGTAKKLKAAEIEVRDVADFVGGKAILGHKVVTLSRELYTALLADYDKPDEMSELRILGLPPIDLVCCDFYPLSEAIAEENATEASVIEATDIGGPTMVRAAAKMGRVVICDPLGREIFLTRLANGQDLSPDQKRELRARAEFIVAGYCLDSARYHSEGKLDGILLRQILELKYGENPYQQAYVFTTDDGDPLCLPEFSTESALPGYVNYKDGDRLIETMSLAAEAFRANFGKVPYIAIAGKHGNPCGFGIDWYDPAEAVTKAMRGDHIAVMGAEVMMNFQITDEVAKRLVWVPTEFRVSDSEEDKKWKARVFFAPGIDEDAKARLDKVSSRVVFINPALLEPKFPKSKWSWKMIRGGAIKQTYPKFVFVTDEVQEWIGKEFTDDKLSTILIAFSVAYTSTSNSVILSKDNMLIGPGVGQQDRIMCCRLAVMRAETAGHDTEDSFWVSDAFFPGAKGDGIVEEGPQILIVAGTTGGIVPAGGSKLEEVIDFFKDTGLNVAILPDKLRGFSQH